MEIVVFGAGSLGSLVGGLLATHHEVTLVAREDHANAIDEQGLRVEGELETHTHPTVTTDGSALEADLVVLAVKSFDTATAARTLSTGSFDVVLSVQNGLGNEELLESTLEVTVLAGTATYGAHRQEPGVVKCTGLGEITLGARTGGTSAVADQVGAAFEIAGLETSVVEDMPRRRWEKLAVNAAINPITALTATENAAILEPETIRLSRAACRETARVARAHGVSLSNRAALETLEAVAESTAANTSSMAQDVRAGKRTEIDAINGAVVERARAVGLEAPVNRTLTELVRTWERETLKNFQR